MKPEIKTIKEMKFVGLRIQTSFANNRTFELWRQFMPRKKEINNAVGVEVYAVDVYPQLFFKDFNPGRTFEKWAAVEVTDFDGLPQGMETLVSPEGMYAVFQYKGLGSQAPKMYQAILQDWLPASEYSLDTRPHFAVMGEKYKNEDPGSEEEFWIPIRLKA